MKETAISGKTINLGLQGENLAKEISFDISEMKKDLSLGENFAEMGLGWLSREDKLEYTQKAKSVTVKLR